MPGRGKRHATSRAQAGFLGAIIGGGASAPELSKAEAKDMLRGVKVRRLPKRRKK